MGMVKKTVSKALEYITFISLVLQFINQMQEELKQLDIKCEYDQEQLLWKPCVPLGFNQPFSMGL